VILGRALVPVVCCLLAASRVAAQLPKDQAWTLEGGSGNYCIWYLAEPEQAKKLVSSSTSLLPAGSGSDLPLDLAAVIKEEPKFAQWIPASICLGFYQRVSLGSRVIAEGKPGRPIIVATHSLAAQAAYRVPGANQYLLDFMTNDNRVSGAADDIGVDMSKIELTQRTRLEGADPTVTVSLSDVLINWTGHTVADSSVGKTRSMSFGYGGPKNSGWLITRESSPRSEKMILAVLWVEGRNKLANLLKSSPVRSIGPMENGGSASISFHAVAHQ
jgi:hypothetical protein